MKAPGVWTAAFFAAGLLLARPAILPHGAASRMPVFFLAGLSLAAALTGLALLRKQRIALAAGGSRVLRTDRDGAVTVSTDGTSLRVSCFVACP